MKTGPVKALCPKCGVEREVSVVARSYIVLAQCGHVVKKEKKR